MHKKRVLVVSEFSLLNTGFSVMSHALLNGLHKTGNYEVAELGSYIQEGDPRIYAVPWEVYPAQPASSDIVATKKYYNKYQENQFGAMVFDDVVLDFKADCVCSFRDFWHDSFICKSKYRHLFYYIWSACVDSEPPKDDWLDLYSKVDCVSSYTQWGLNVLRRYAGEGLINIADVDTMPGVDLEIFKPLDRKKIRDKYGLREDALILMKCARNQVRKLYPELIRSFMNAMDHLYKIGCADIADRSFLYLHTSLEDVGWDLIKEIKRYNASHKVLFTYFCTKCSAVYPSFVSGKQTFCRKCKSPQAITTNTAFGVSRETLAEIYNLADAYIQVQIAGACELPLLEARACGIPTLAVNYAAPTEFQSLPGSLGLIDVGLFRQESIQETSQFRGYVDEEDLTKKICKILRMPEEKRQEYRLKQRETAEKYHGFDIYVDKWISLIEEAPTTNQERWYEKPQPIVVSQDQIPWQLSDPEFVRWCCTTILPPSHYCNRLSYEMDMLKKLAQGYEIVGQKSVPFTRQSILAYIFKEADEFNHFEAHRYNKLVLEPQRKEEQKVNLRVYS